MKSEVTVAMTVLLTSVHAFAVYDPVEGRWMSRDPIEEKGGQNLYAFCKNDPVNKFDKLGLQSSCRIDPSGMMSCIVESKCCNGVEYNPLTHCCIDNKIFSRTKKATGIKLCCAYQDSLFSALGYDFYAPLHCWLEYPGGTKGFYPYPQGVIPETTYPQIKNTTPIPSEPFKICWAELVATECEYDLDAISSCIKDASNILPFLGGFHDCRHWASITYGKCLLKGLRW